METTKQLGMNEHSIQAIKDGRIFKLTMLNPKTRYQRVYFLDISPDILSKIKTKDSQIDTKLLKPLIDANPIIASQTGNMGIHWIQQIIDPEYLSIIQDQKPIWILK